MEYRCEWCGKPQPEDDPPCDNCGHGTFERAVVRQHETVETVDVAWACTSCGRVHQRNSPPCSRCGHTTFERTDPATDTGGGDLPGPDARSYRDLASPQYAAAAIVGVAAVVALALAAGGLLSVPLLEDGSGSGSGNGPPDPPPAPGEGDVVGNVSLEAAEEHYVARLNEGRTGRNETGLVREPTLTSMAEYFNRRIVAHRHANGTAPDFEETERRFDYDCQRQTQVLVHRVDVEAATGRPVGAFDSSRSLGRALAATYLGLDSSVAPGREEIGVDVHVAPDRSTYVTLVYC